VAGRIRFEAQKTGRRLDMDVDSAYTTEFLDGPEKQAEKPDNRGREQEQRHADGGMH
jgi:hypothetical protein